MKKWKKERVARIVLDYYNRTGEIPSYEMIELELRKCGQPLTKGKYPMLHEVFGALGPKTDKWLEVAKEILEEEEVERDEKLEEEALRKDDYESYEPMNEDEFFEYVYDLHDLLSEGSLRAIDDISGRSCKFSRKVYLNSQGVEIYLSVERK